MTKLDSEIVIKYEGGDADRHFVEMRVLGNSLIGFERIISDGLIFFGENRLPRRGERHTLSVRAQEPVAGSLEIPIVLTQAAGLLPFAWWMMQTGATEVVSQWMTYVFTKLSGRKNEASAALEKLEAMREIEARERLESQRQWLEHEAAWRDQLFQLTNRLVIPAIRAVAPVGPSVNQLKLNGTSAAAFVVDLATADAIRARGELEMTDLQSISLRVDGFVHHTKKLSVENPDLPGTYISADVRDPVFENLPNGYIDAAGTKSVIQVQAKLGYRAGVLEKIYIMDGIRLTDAA